MAKKRYTKKRTTHKRKYGKRRYTLRKALMPETKSLVAALAPATNTTGSITLLNAIAKGTNDTGRIGNQVVIKSVWIRGFAAVTPATGVDQIHRYMLVWDKAPEGATPAITDILNAVTVYSFPNEDNRWRFKLMFDKTFSLNATAEAGSIKPIKPFIKCIKKVHYNDNSLGDIRDIQSGALYFVAIGTSAAGATAGSYTGQSIIKFLDP